MTKTDKHGKNAGMKNAERKTNYKQQLSFDPNCRLCPRLTSFLTQVKLDYPSYFCNPVPPFGADNAHLLVVGLAPGIHGANRTGRPFTGDHAGILLYQTLHKFGFASAHQSISDDDGLILHQCRITNAVKCLPPANKPTTAEIVECNSFLAEEIATLPKPSVLLALGNVAHMAVIRALKLKPKAFAFSHAARHELADDMTLYDSYHCSRYNTQTKRLTEAMFHEVFKRIKEELSCHTLT